MKKLFIIFLCFVIFSSLLLGGIFLLKKNNSSSSKYIEKEKYDALSKEYKYQESLNFELTDACVQKDEEISSLKKELDNYHKDNNGYYLEYLGEFKGISVHVFDSSLFSPSFFFCEDRTSLIPLELDLIQHMIDNPEDLLSNSLSFYSKYTVEDSSSSNSSTGYIFTRSLFTSGISISLLNPNSFVLEDFDTLSCRINIEQVSDENDGFLAHVSITILDVNYGA